MHCCEIFQLCGWDVFTLEYFKEMPEIYCQKEMDGVNFICCKAATLQDRPKVVYTQKWRVQLYVHNLRNSTRVLTGNTF